MIEDEDILESTDNLLFLTERVRDHIKKLTELTKKLAKDDFRIAIQLISLRTELEITLHTIEHNGKRLIDTD